MIMENILNYDEYLLESNSIFKMDNEAKEKLLKLDLYLCQYLIKV